MVILLWWAKWRPSLDFVSGVCDAVPACFLRYKEVPVLGVSLCLMAAWCSCWVPGCLHTRTYKWEECSAKVPGAPGVKCLCAVLLCKATWEAIPNSEEAPCNNNIIKTHLPGLAGWCYVLQSVAACEVKSLWANAAFPTKRSDEDLQSGAVTARFSCLLQFYLMIEFVSTCFSNSKLVISRH